jgi:hypothetical protein
MHRRRRIVLSLILLAYVAGGYVFWTSIIKPILLHRFPV